MQGLEGGFVPLFTDRVVTWFTQVVNQSSEWLSSIGLIWGKNWSFEDELSWPLMKAFRLTHRYLCGRLT